MKTVRIANGQAFWGDSVNVPGQMVARGGFDYLTLDYLAEVTMSILQKQRARNPELGYARDFVTMLEPMMADLLEKGIRVVANAGGVNPLACRAAVLDIARRQGLAGKLRVGVVTGDDLLPQLDDLVGQGADFAHFDLGTPFSEVREQITSANAYLGAGPIAAALADGAHIVITGRCSDASLTVGPLVHEFGWALDDWDRLAAATVAGHIIECGAQGSGGNTLIDWERIPDMADIGYPLVEVTANGDFVVTKQPGTGGRVDVPGVTEQLLYELREPQAYITADCVADFTSIQLRQQGPDRVAVSGVRGAPATASYKVSMSYPAGYKAVGSLVYAWPDALAKARAGDRILRKRLHDLGLRYEQTRTEYVGAGACHGLSPEQVADLDLPEVQLRVAVRDPSRDAVSAFAREIAPLVCNGPPTVTGFAGGRPKVEEVVAYWPALVARDLVVGKASVEVA